jgi:hypothetical protein
MRGRRVLTVIAMTAALLAGCGTEAAESTGPGSTTEQAPTTSTTVPLCGAATADLVASALGEPATFLGTDESGCGFTAGQWSLGVRAEHHDPAPQERAVNGPTLDGVSVPHSAWLNNDRSGQWKVNATLVVDDVLYALFLQNHASGSDTYPPSDGPEQRPVTAAAAAALINALAQPG